MLSCSSLLSPHLSSSPSLWLAGCPSTGQEQREEHPILTAFIGGQPALLWLWWVDEEELLHCCMHTELTRTSNMCLFVEIPWVLVEGITPGGGQTQMSHLPLEQMQLSMYGVLRSFSDHTTALSVVWSLQ